MGSKVSISEKSVRAQAAEKGIVVSKVTISASGERALTVGAVRVYHDGRGGKACWRVDGVEQWSGYIGEAIEKALAL